jgi:hypothetical protein
MAQFTNDKNNVGKSEELREQNLQEICGGRDEHVGHEVTHVFQSDAPAGAPEAATGDQFNGKYFVTGTTHAYTSK